MLKRTLLLAALAVVISLTALGSVEGAYEQPVYQVVSSDGEFELRRYAPYLVVETVVDGDFDRARSQAFRRLFRYISAKDRRNLRPDDPEISMTVPVTMSQRGGATRMTFMVPSRYTLETAPQPANSSVRLREEPGGLVAVHVYSGRSSQERFLEREARLRDWLAANGLNAAGDAAFAGYDAPFKPWFLRRNEVLIPVNPPN